MAQSQMTTPETERPTATDQDSPLPAHVRNRYRDPNGVLQNDPQRGIVRVRAEDLKLACSLIVDRLVAYGDAVYGEGDPEGRLIECAAEGWDELHRHARQLAALAGALGEQQGRIDADPRWQPEEGAEYPVLPWLDKPTS